VRQVGGGLSLTSKSFDECLTFGVLAVKDLDRDLAAQEAIFGHPDVGHSTPGEVGDEGVSVREDSCRFHDRGWYRRL
jgi:hypothetical protein